VIIDGILSMLFLLRVEPMLVSIVGALASSMRRSGSVHGLDGLMP